MPIMPKSVWFNFHQVSLVRIISLVQVNLIWIYLDRLRVVHLSLAQVSLVTFSLIQVISVHVSLVDVWLGLVLCRSACSGSFWFMSVIPTSVWSELVQSKSVALLSRVQFVPNEFCSGQFGSKMSGLSQLSLSYFGRSQFDKDCFHSSQVVRFKLFQFMSIWSGPLVCDNLN